MQAYLLGHTLKRIAGGAGEFTWSVDDGPERFVTMDEAADWIRRQPRWRAHCRTLHQPRCRSRRSDRRSPEPRRAEAAPIRSHGPMRLASL